MASYRLVGWLLICILLGSSDRCWLRSFDRRLALIKLDVIVGRSS